MNITEKYEKWLEKATEDTDIVADLLSVKDCPHQQHERFYQGLKFGTGGLRGVLGGGTNRMNIYTVRAATQGMARVLLRQSDSPSVAIAYDSRIKSDVFAKETASVLAANGIKVWLFDQLMPTPILSWAVITLRCTGGVVITASHNPSMYNGYKAYGTDGCQVGETAADEIFNEIQSIDPFEDVLLTDFADAVSSGYVQYIPQDVIEGYYNRVLSCSKMPEILEKSDLSVCYTPLCGTGLIPVTTILKRAGVEKVSVVENQREPNGNFPTCPYPNPETDEALAEGVALLKEIGGDILIGTDPDADRIGVCVHHNGDYHRLSGNQMGVLLVDYIANTRLQLGTMPAHPQMVKSIVSTPLADKVAAQYGVEMHSVLTGFKYIGEFVSTLVLQGHKDEFLFGFEESCGYLPEGYIREKDGMAATLLTVEMASLYKRSGKTLIDKMEEIYQLHGYFEEKVMSFAFEGSDGMNQMISIMNQLFANPLEMIGDFNVSAFKNLRDGTITKNKIVEKANLPHSDVVIMELDNESTVIIRPSGTEPKLKIYFMCPGETNILAKAVCDVLVGKIKVLLKL